MDSLTSTLKEQKNAYSQGHERPLGSYLATLATYGGLVGALTAAAKISGRRAPEIRMWDLALMTAATHKVARTLSKDPVTSPLRAPFTRYKGSAGPSEVAEQVRGQGGRHAVGELLSCPFCSAQWVATGYTAGLVFAPGITRLAGATMTAIAGADWLQLLYSRLQKAATSS